MDSLDIRLIRHATGSREPSTDVMGAQGYEIILSKTGLNEAIRKGMELKDTIAPDIIISSPAVRCIETAHMALFAMDLMCVPIKVANDLMEVNSGRDTPGRHRKNTYTLTAQHMISEAGLSYSYEGGESMNQVGNRGLRWLDIQKMNANFVHSILAFSHPGLITNTVGAIEGWDTDERLKRMASVTTASETRIVLENDEWHVDSFAKPLET
jgi:broad specificity phosphatase PhoE